MTNMDKLTQIRARIAAIQSEQKMLEEQKRSRKQIGEYLDAVIEHAATKAADHLRTNTARAASGVMADFFTVYGMSVQGPVAVNMAPLLVMMMGADAVRKAAGQALAAIPEGAAPLARARQIKELADTLHTACMEEESLIREAERRGEIIAYRADADPAYALMQVPAK